VWKIRQTRRFARMYKKLHDAVAVDVDAVIASVQSEPHAGDRKKGDLASLYVMKFHSQNNLHLLGYTCDEEMRVIYLEAVGAHENFYRNLKKQLKN